MIQEITKELGAYKILPEEIPEIIRPLLTMRRVICRSGPGEWLHACSSAMFTDEDLCASPRKILENVDGKRKILVGDLLRLASEKFGDRNHDDWNMVVLKSEWLKETFCMKDGSLILFMVIAFLFEPRDVPDVVPDRIDQEGPK